ncbi:SRPBCC domain-containing protein [Serinibacter arcticus]|uniref:SRPBCC domain-containing protein n=1 Tax=Serinibacter arcticus TaxID=1655435 RepID=A0A2U1ZSB0_9MICO|nr:SRPBCC domain-containing protein [Serinibacter arcticus]PWD49869.1 SRPBCC domain-containing protein [Serinibacter arcticus]
MTTTERPRPALDRRRRRRRRALVALGIVVVLVGAALGQRAHPYRLESTVEIDAPREVVWDVLTDFGAYPEWNPALVGMAGELAVGETLRFATDASDDALVFEPVVREVRPEEELRWEGRLLLGGLFDGEHSFELRETDTGGTVLVQVEDFRGIAVPFLTGWLRENTLPDFVAMNDALRERAEAGAVAIDDA